MDRNAAVDRSKTENFVAVDRVAAFGQLVFDIAQRLVDYQCIVGAAQRFRGH